MLRLRRWDESYILTYKGPGLLAREEREFPLSRETYERVVELTAWLCHTFQLNPETEVIRHYDVTGKICPRYYVEHPEAWEQFLADTEAALEALNQQEG